MRTAKLIAITFLVAAAAAGCGGSGSTPGAPSEGASVAPSASADAGGASVGMSEVAIAGFAFAPADVSVPIGTTVTWSNKDSAPHTVTFDEGSADSGRLGQGATFELAFDSAGTFAYHCAIHPSMKGTVTVTP